MASSPLRRLDGKPILLVVGPENFREEELDEPRDVLEREGADVTVACRRLGEARGMLGERVMPEVTLRDVKARDFDSIVVVGGTGSPKHLWNDDDLASLVRDVHAAGKVVGGICLSGAVLAGAGVLKDLEATVYRTTESLEELRRGGAKFVSKAVVTSGNVVTASGPEAATEFGKALVATIVAAAASSAAK